ncbi:MAG: YadA C-terminal domain-containing protein, partial [Erythrobacter sp.]|nr:YadA C-terminal domain-containing protein [Erythrobacter sp.]
LGTSTTSQTGTIFAVTTDSNGTLGRSALATTASVAAANTAIAANTASIGANTAAINTANANIASLQSLTSNQTAQINTLFGQTSQLRDAVERANEGVAMALAMESPMLPAGTNFGLSGGIGYYDDRTAGTLAVSARVGTNASVGAGIGVGFDSGEVGARGGFQIAF